MERVCAFGGCPSSANSDKVTTRRQRLRSSGRMADRISAVQRNAPHGDSVAEGNVVNDMENFCHALMQHGDLRARLDIVHGNRYIVQQQF